MNFQFQNDFSFCPVMLEMSTKFQPESHGHTEMVSYLYK